MYYINPKINESGSYPPLQTTKAEGLLIFPDSYMSVFYPSDKRFAGFVIIEDDGERVTSCVWNDEAYEAYAAEHPEVEPEEPEEEKTVWDELDEAYQEGVDSI